MYQNGDFSWRSFFLGFLTRKFLIAVGIQIVVTYLAYDAFDIVMKGAETGKAVIDPKTIIEIFERWCYFTIANAASFGLFNSTSKFASNSLEKIKTGLSSMLPDGNGSQASAAPASNVQPPPDQRD